MALFVEAMVATTVKGGDAVLDAACGTGFATRADARDLHERAVALPPIAEYVPEHLKALPWSAGFFELSSKEQALTIVWMEERLADYRTDDGIDVPFGSYLATAAI
jgi:hypothetical protein